MKTTTFKIVFISLLYWDFLWTTTAFFVKCCDIYLCQTKKNHFQKQGIHQRQRKMIHHLCFCFPSDPACPRRSPQKGLLQKRRQHLRGKYYWVILYLMIRDSSLKKEILCYRYDSSFEIFDATELNTPPKKQFLCSFWTKFCLIFRPKNNYKK